MLGYLLFDILRYELMIGSFPSEPTSTTICPVPSRIDEEACPHEEDTSPPPYSFVWSYQRLEKAFRWKGGETGAPVCQSGYEIKLHRIDYKVATILKHVPLYVTSPFRVPASRDTNE